MISTHAGANDPDRLRSILRPLAERYNWFAAPEIALKNPIDFLARVMDLGTLDDICYVEDNIEPAAFRAAIERARVGDFRPRSWSFWHYRLRLIEPGAEPPDPPGRRVYHD